MKSLIGYLKKILLLSSLLFLFLILPKPINAQVDVSTSATFTHEILESRINTLVTVTISSSTPKVISYYTTAIPIKNLDVRCSNARTGKTLECSTYQKTSSTDILFDLQNAVVKPDLPFLLNISYSIPSENTNSFQIPSYITDTDTKKITVIYPSEKGTPLWTSDTIQNLRKIGNTNYQIEINNPIYETLSILFGKNLIYSFEINRVFTNSLGGENQTFELIVPPDTSNQSIIWDSFNPMPNSAIEDEDGNYIFKYVVPPQQSIDCNIKGYIYKNETVAEDENEVSSLYTRTLGYWKISENAEFRRINAYITKNTFTVPDDFASVDILSNTQKEGFVRYVYKYVIERLHFDKDIELGLGEERRVGANEILDNVAQATQIDYADFLIAILRNYDIPSRMVIGYISNISGYTSDGFYHYWVEYYNEVSKKWIILDPFLEDYFDKSFYGSQFSDHLSILRRGNNPLSPNITFYQENDFLVTATPSIEITPEFKFKSELTFEDAIITNPYTKGHIYIVNEGNIAISNYSILKSNIENIKEYIDPINNMNSQILLPNQNSLIQINLPTPQEEKNIFINIRFKNNGPFSGDILLESDIEPTTPILLLILVKILSTLFFVVVITFLYFGIIKILRKNE